jgi:SAM-dependent methyltransferase
MTTDFGRPAAGAPIVTTAGEAANRLAPLTDAMWALAAVGVALQDGTLLARPLAADDPVTQVLAQLGLAVADGDRAELAPGFRALLETAGDRAQLDSLMANIRQVAGVVGVAPGGPVARWATQDDEVLLAQGGGSAANARLLARVIVPQLPGLAQRLGAPGSRFLDVGVGVGGLAAAMCEELPGLRVVGIDVLPRALDLARSTVADRGVGDRIELRLLDVARLDDVDSYDLAWLPAPFVPAGAVDEALPRLRRAMRPGGWLLVGMARLEGDPLAVAVTVWRTALFGGVVMGPEQAAGKLEAAGFVDVTRLPNQPGVPVLVAARAP